MRQIKIRKLVIPFIFLGLIVTGCTAEATLEPTTITEASEVAAEEVYTPPSVDICPTIQQAAADALGVEFTLEASAPFEDTFAGESGHGCKLTANGNGSNFTSAQDVITTLSESAALGWTEQMNYRADGPTGASDAFARDMALMILSANWQPAEGVECPSDQPISACELTPEQKVYSIEIDIAEYQANFSLDGHWVDEETGFTLDLYQDWKNLYGQHTIVADGGNKIDSLEASISGMVDADGAIVEFKSSFTDAIGTAQLTYIDVNTMQWTIITAPDGENYFPASALLKR